MEVLIINGHDYSSHIEQRGYGWSRNDMDSDNSQYTKAGTYRRDRITTKRTLTYTLTNMTRLQLAQLDDDLSDETFSATYLDLHGPDTRTFFCTGFTATLESVYGEGGEWGQASFTLTEV